MKPSNRKKSQAKTTSAQTQASAGPEGIAVTPPRSGIDFVDQGLDEAQPLSASDLGQFEFGMSLHDYLTSRMPMGEQAFEATRRVRNSVMEAYKEIMQMPI